MRELILGMSMSLDGFVAGPEGDISWIFTGDPEAIAWKVENASNASLHIMGSRTFQKMAAHWPTASGPFGPPMNRIPKAVFSKQGPSILQAANTAGAESWAEAYVASGDLAEEITKLKSGDGKPILAHGGAAFARSLIEHDLVDEYALLVYPIALGRGLPIFGDLSAPRPLTLVRTKHFPGGTVGQTYRLSAD